MEGIRRNAWRVFNALRPSFLSKDPHFNFITAHYFWIIAWSIVGSILLFASGNGNITYIDALFFASGANTQAGLNTVDVNLLNTFQQVVLFCLSMMSNPITLHTSVVFLRLYWFEKRFQDVAKTARQRRTTITQSRSKAKAAPSDIEKGVNGRDITVMHHTAQKSRITNDGILLDKQNSVNGTNMNGSAKLDQSHSEAPHPGARDTQIKFSDNFRRSDTIPEDEDMAMPLPSKRSDAEHIAILERQRKQDKGALRIPGPRDADRGAVPEEVEEDEEWDGDGLAPGIRKRRQSSIDAVNYERPQARQPASHTDRQQTITIAEPQHPKRDEAVEDAEASAPTHINALQRIKTALTQNQDDPMPYLPFHPTIGRNSEFLGLTEEERELLGGIEYRSLKTLAGVLVVYFWGFWIIALVCLLPWIMHADQYGKIVEGDGISRGWWGVFTANSAFMDLGFTLTPDSMISFNTARFPLLVMSFFIVIGNTGFPIMLRCMIWVFHLFVPRDSGLFQELRFLLDHPRRCFTLLFPSTATWWLFGILLILNVVDLIFFIILDLGRGPIAELPLDIRFLNGWFQAASTRTAGFASVNLADLHPAVQTSYLIMMYISVFPIAISVRRTNVYEERALGLYGSSNDIDDNNENQFSYVGSHLRRQLSFDLWFIFVGYFILTITEGSRLLNNDFSMFAVLFDVVSAYGTVGLSLGYPNTNTSLCAQFTVIGKLVMIAMQIRGRHRGLPYGLDRAILLPSDSLNRKEAEDAELRLQRRNSAVSVPGGRAASLAARGRSRSIDHRNVVTQFLHVGPTYPLSSFSTHKTDHFPVKMNSPEIVRRTVSEPLSDDEGSPKARPRTRRADTQSALPIR